MTPLRTAPVTEPALEQPIAICERWSSSRMQRPRPRGFWCLLACAVVLSVGVAGLGVYLLGSGRSVAPPPQRRIAVPYAADAGLLDLYRRRVVQEDGREKPFDTFGRESVRTITGRDRFEGNDPVAVVLSWMMSAGDEDPACDWDHYPFILCDFPALRDLLYQDHRGPDSEMTKEDRRGRYVEPSVLRFSSVFQKLVREATARRMEDARAPLSAVEEKAREVNNRLELYQRIRTWEAFGVVGLDRRGRTWFGLAGLREFTKDPGRWQKALELRRIENPAAYQGQPVQPFPAAEVKEVLASFEVLRQAYLTQRDHTPAAATADFFAVIDRVSSQFGPGPGPDTLPTELWFNRVNPFRWAWVAALLAAVLLTGSVCAGRRGRVAGRVHYLVGLLAYAGALGWSAVGFYCRVRISGRPPVSNMYESIIWVALMAAVFGLALELVYRRRVIALAGVLVSALGFVLADQLPLTFSPAIQPLQAVLRSNYWLVIHVLTIVSSYAAFALAWGLGNGTLALMVFAPGRHDLVRLLARYGYRAIQVGVVLLAAGTLLGGFWAAESWGRFWGWDPKEVWALIALLCYLIPLHARYVGWVKEFGLAVCAVVCFAAVVMAWYGVNFVLGAGLHSYGFGGGNDLWVYWGGLFNLDVVVLAALRYRYAPRTPGVEPGSA
jgi:ABC-type transport system involved in cytochrome c biogenesis permease subunit